MDCTVCGRKTDVGEMIKCNGCKAVYHHRCVNISSAAFKEGQVQLKRTFLCDTCANVTRRTRITDDTPVRGARAGPMEPNQSFGENVSQAKAESLTSDEIVDKFSSIVMSKISAFETNILQEIKATVAVLALENSALREELKEVNMKCWSYEKRIKELETELIGEKNESHDIDTNSQKQRQARVPLSKTPKSTISSATPTPPLPNPAETSYAAVTRKATDAKVENKSGNDWIEVKNNRRSNPIKRGGNNSIASLKAVERKKFLHVWRLEKNTTEDSLKVYIRQILGDDSEILVQKLITRTERDYASFRIGVTVSHYEKLCDPDLWPINVEYSEWIWFRPSNQPKKL